MVFFNLENLTCGSMTSWTGETKNWKLQHYWYMRELNVYWLSPTILFWYQTLATMMPRQPTLLTHLWHLAIFIGNFRHCAGVNYQYFMCFDLQQKVTKSKLCISGRNMCILFREIDFSILRMKLRLILSLRLSYVISFVFARWLFRLCDTSGWLVWCSSVHPCFGH